MLLIFKITDISLSSQNCISTSDINVKNKLIFTILEKDLEQELKQKFPCASELNVQKIFPSKLDVQVTVITPVVQITDSDLAITAAGEIVRSGSNLPTLFTSKLANPTLGQKVTDKDLIFTLMVADLLVKTDFLTASLRLIGPNEIVAYSTTQLVAVFSASHNADKQVDSLQQVLAKAKIDGNKIAKIDLRFDKPVISFK